MLMPAAAALPNRPRRKGEATAERILDEAEALSDAGAMLPLGQMEELLKTVVSIRKASQ